jgi:hypothetical protein
VQSRIVPHRVFPDAVGPAARWIENDVDIHAVIRAAAAQLRRAVARRGRWEEV